MIVTITAVAGAPPNPQSIGQFKAALVDIELESEGANDAGDFVLDPARVGLNEILGVLDAHVYAGGAAADVPRSVDFVPSTNTVTFYAADRAALDLDAGNTAQARLLVLGY